MKLMNCEGSPRSQGIDSRWRALATAIMAGSVEGPSRLVAGQVVSAHRGALSIEMMFALHEVHERLLTRGATRVVRVDLATPGHSRGESWPPVVGDWLVLEEMEHFWRIAAQLPRRTLIERPSATRTSTPQALVANADVLLIVEPCVPPPSVGRVERFAALAHAAGIECWLVVTKTDLDDQEHIAKIADEFSASVDAVMTVGGLGDELASTNVDTGIDVLARQLRDLRSYDVAGVLVGRSGAGKSTLVNALIGTSLPTGAVRSGDGKGRHTTTVRQLARGEGLALIDTPGIRALAATADQRAVDDTYREVADIALRCRFANCRHDGEPGCAVALAVSEGVLDGERVERYLRMLRESTRQRQRQDSRLAREADRKASRDNTRGRRVTMHLKGRQYN